jgi:hypothetical protein
VFAVHFEWRSGEGLPGGARHDIVSRMLAPMGQYLL